MSASSAAPLLPGARTVSDVTGGALPAKRRILVLYASFGGGHRSAANAVVQYLNAHYRRSVEVTCLDFFKEFAPALDVLGRFTYTQSVQYVPELYGTFFDISNKMPRNPMVHELAQAGYGKAEAFIEAWLPDAVIATYPAAGQVFSDVKETRDLFTAAVVTDYGGYQQWMQPGIDLFFVACREAGEDLAARGVPWEDIVVSGIPIHERFRTKPDRAECREEFGLDDRFTVLLTAAAGMTADLRKLTGDLVDAGIQVAAATGDHKRLRRALLSVQKKHPGAHILGNVKEMNRIMAASDILVGKAGGLTVSEALAVGLPLVLHNPIPGQEMYNVDFLVNYGAGLFARDEDDVVEKVRFLSRHPTRLRQMADNARLVGKPDAARAVCERVLDEVLPDREPVETATADGGESAPV
jgi:processive 1,2-diacylglycerol beta-glucosyltransferase